MYSHWNNPIVYEAVDRREQQVQDHLDERDLPRTERASRSRKHSRSVAALRRTLSRHTIPWTANQTSEPEV